MVWRVSLRALSQQKPRRRASDVERFLGISPDLAVDRENGHVASVFTRAGCLRLGDRIHLIKLFNDSRKTADLCLRSAVPGKIASKEFCHPEFRHHAPPFSLSFKRFHALDRAPVPASVAGKWGFSAKWQNLMNLELFACGRSKGANCLFVNST